MDLREHTRTVAGVEIELDRPHLDLDVFVRFHDSGQHRSGVDVYFVVSNIRLDWSFVNEKIHELTHLIYQDQVITPQLLGQQIQVFNVFFLLPDQELVELLEANLYLGAYFWVDFLYLEDVFGADSENVVDLLDPPLHFIGIILGIS